MNFVCSVNWIEWYKCVCVLGYACTSVYCIKLMQIFSGLKKYCSDGCTDDSAWIGLFPSHVSLSSFFEMSTL